MTGGLCILAWICIGRTGDDMQRRQMFFAWMRGTTAVLQDRVLGSIQSAFLFGGGEG